MEELPRELFISGGAPTYEIVHKPKEMCLQRTEIIPASPIDRQKCPRYCERCLECFAVFQKFYVLIPRFIAESLGSAEPSWGSSGLKYRFHDFHALGHIAKFPANKDTWTMGISETPRSDKGLEVEAVKICCLRLNICSTSLWTEWGRRKLSRTASLRSK
jgi:hypothetical protein